MINDLPKNYREALILSDLKNNKQKDIAEKLDISYSGVKSRVQRGRVLLQKSFKDCCNIEINNYGQLISGDLEMNNCSKC